MPLSIVKSSSRLLNSVQSSGLLNKEHADASSSLLIPYRGWFLIMTNCVLKFLCYVIIKMYCKIENALKNLVSSCID